MQQAGVGRDFISFDSSISACEKGEQWSAALQLFKDMGDVTIKRIAPWQHHKVLTFCCMHGKAGTSDAGCDQADGSPKIARCVATTFARIQYHANAPCCVPRCYI